MATKFAERVIEWYKKYGRKDLPWQQDITPYRVWVSEIMLQQTQVATVIPYFTRFMKRFPTIQDLANATLDEVTALWSGLGYYSRARNLHKTAQQIVTHHQGKFPEDLVSLVALPGIGRSTAGAILSLSMDIPAAILDGNVKRILTRAFCVEGWPDSTTTQKQLWEIAEKHMPSTHSRHYSQGMMDIGALICTRTKPQCTLCPLNTTCQAHASHTETLFPHKRIKKALPTRSTYMLLLEHETALLLEQRPPAGIWGGLWSFPEVTELDQLSTHLKKTFGMRLLKKRMLRSFKHTFSHYHLAITPVHIQVEPLNHQVMDAGPRLWYTSHSKIPLGLPRPTSQLINQFNEGEWH